MLEVRQADENGVGLLLQWAKAEGWNPGLDDAKPFYAADPEGFLMGYVDGEPVSGISVVSVGDHFGFLGFFIVHPGCRRKGFGRDIWNAGIAKLGSRTIGLDGVVAQRANYARSNFAFAHRSIRFRGHAQSGSGVIPSALPIQQRHLPKITAFDTEHYGASRAGFLSAWLDGSGRRRGLYIVTDGKISGYGVIRPCHSGFKIGPLFARTAKVAEALFSSLLETVGEAEVFIDVPEPNAGGLNMVERFNFSPAFETARMYRGLAPQLPLQDIYGFTSFELG